MSNRIMETADSFKLNGLQYKTFKAWSKTGFKIKKGEKAAHYLNGVPVFSRNQVTRPPWYNSIDMEDDAEMGFCYGISPWGDN